MQFGKVTNPAIIDFSLPEDTLGTTKIISSNSNLAPLQVNVGCAKWNK